MKDIASAAIVGLCVALAFQLGKYKTPYAECIGILSAQYQQDGDPKIKAESDAAMVCAKAFQWGMR